MNNKEFCHLHLHSEHSLLDGVGSSIRYAKRAKKMGFKYLACTDHGNIDGLIKHQKACEAEGIVPLFGCEMYIVPDLTIKDKNEKSGHLTILVKNQAGWIELCRLLTIANLEGFYRRPRIDYKTFLDADLSGLIVLTGCSGSFLNRKFGEGFFWNLVEEMKKDLFLEIMPHDMPEQISHNKKCKELSGKYGIPLVATNDIHYILLEEDIVQEVLLAIQTHARWKDKDRWKFNIKGLHLRSCEEMIVAFKKQNSLNDLDYGKALRNTIIIAEKCKDFRIERQQVSLPKIKRPKKYERVDSTELLFILCEKKKRKKQEWNSEYQKRLNYELEIIQKKKFERYFLIVWDLVRWCKKNDVMIGSGRGSVGGSLTAYLLGITCVDPLKYNLLFSRFINEKRIDLPDIDIDFEDRKREQVRQYLEDTYGKDNVSGISTFLQMKGRATVRDVARVFDIPLKEADMFAKAIEYGEDKSAIQKAIKETQEGHDFESKYPDETKVMLKLEGTVKSCVSGNSRVLVLKERFPLRAKAATIKSLFDKNFRGKIRSYNFEKGHFFFDKIKDIYFAGIKEVIKIEVGMSTSLTLTSDHRVLSKRGWVKAEELKVGELVATNGRKGQIAWNKGLKGVCAAWNKGLKGVQVAWNKGLSKKDHFFIRQASERWKKNNPLKKIENKIKVAKRSFKHGLYSKKTREIIKNNLYCQCCKKNKSQEIHHLDKNRYNNKVHNLIAVCVKCHNKYHPKPNPPKLNEFLTIKYRRITKIEKKGQEETYDICMRSRHQNYVCNKIITHNSGQHAAAVVISSENLKLGTKGNLCRRGKDIVVSNWDMEDAEYMGLMKLDILGLSALSILSETKKLILENHKEEIVFEQIPAEDRKVLNTLSKGNTVGIFQLSTSLSTDMCKEVGVDVFEDIVSVLAIARPGSLHSGTTKDFINRKQGRRWEKIHPTYDEITKSTYGVLIFQEQVMEVFHKVAGLPYGVADNIRKIIGKKRDVKEFEKYKQQFSDGCAKLKTFNTREVEWFWEMLLKCANYLFNRCLSKNETIYRSKGNNKYNKLNIEEMYKIKNDREYAIKTGHRSLHDKYRTFGYGSALSLCKDKKLRKNAIVDIYYSGKMPVYKIILKGGKTLICTLNHSVPTPQGMKKVSELKIGDLLFTKGKYEKTNHNQKFNFYKKGEYKGNFPTRGQEGFQKIKNGRSVLFQQFKKKCRKQKKPCDLCQKRYNKKLRFEVHHIDFYRINNDVSNLQFLCPSCHKKIHYQNGRLKQYEKGLLVKERKIISIDYIGEEDCYDVEMNSPNHNFLTGNGIIVSNSHAVSYGILAQWTAYCKYYYPTEFICASLTYGAEDKKVELIEEAKRLGLKIVPPKIGLSDSLKWKTGDRCLYIPFIEIKGFGESTAEKCLTKVKNKQLGFFNLFAERENEVQGKTKVDRILNEIKAFDLKDGVLSTEAINKYLSFKI